MKPSEIFDDVRERIVDAGGNGDDPRISDTYLLRVYNRGRRDWARRTNALQKTATLTVLANTGEIAVPADFYSPASTYLDGRLLEPRSRERIIWGRSATSGVTTGTPTVMCIWARAVQVAPIPTVNTALTLDYYASASMVVDLAVESGDPKDMEDAVTEFVTAKAWQALENPSAAGDAMAAYEKMVEDAETNFDGPEEIRDVYDDVNHGWR